MSLRGMSVIGFGVSLGERRRANNVMPEDLEVRGGERHDTAGEH